MYSLKSNETTPGPVYDMESRFIQFGPKVLHTRISAEFLQKSLEQLEDPELQSCAKFLAGMITKELELSNLATWFSQSFDKYMTEYLFSDDLVKPKIWTPLQVWANWQGPGDYSPEHVHEGDLSFVYYLSIPPELKEEHSSCVKPNGGPGAIVLGYGEAGGTYIKNQESFLPEEGDLLIFPSNLRHQVLGFRSEVLRVSIAGNIQLEY